MLVLFQKYNFTDSNIVVDKKLGILVEEDRGAEPIIQLSFKSCSSSPWGWGELLLSLWISMFEK